MFYVKQLDDPSKHTIWQSAVSYLIVTTTPSVDSNELLLMIVMSVRLHQVLNIIEDSAVGRIRTSASITVRNQFGFSHPTLDSQMLDSAPPSPPPSPGL